MRANAGVWKNLARHVSTSWSHSEPRIHSLINKETAADLTLTVVSSAGVGFLLVELYRAMETWTITGAGVSVTGIF